MLMCLLFLQRWNSSAEGIPNSNTTRIAIEEVCDEDTGRQECRDVALQATIPGERLSPQRGLESSTFLVCALEWPGHGLSGLASGLAISRHSDADGRWQTPGSNADLCARHPTHAAQAELALRGREKEKATASTSEVLF
ncbi:hypothetical protein B2J93_5503 [Marssonina coronariae]|uniref:Uncharacterized protein n=1 Tax=Diplocarpon coronariae TaxID=2795749 RepID=A0A218Z103_9HELO|nr:hypothetical protein B2J93_5503 [Marssonina coronariae]